MKDYRTDERRLSDYYSNCLKQFIRIDSESIQRFWEILKFKADAKTFDFNPKTRKLFFFFLLLALYSGDNVKAPIKRYLDTEEKKLLNIGPTSLSIKDKEEVEKELISLFISQDVKDEMRKLIDNMWDGRIDVDETEHEELERLHKDLCLFGHDYRCIFK